MDVVTPVRVRVARGDDLDAVGALTLRSYDALTTFSDEYREQLGNARLRADTDATILVGIVGTEVVGSLALSVGHTEMFEHRFGVDGDCNFRMLAVDPPFEGRGVGRALVRDAIDRARAAGCRRMVITSMDFMVRAHAMYDRFGFTRRPDLDVRYPSGVGFGFTLDLAPDAVDHFPPPGPVPPEPPWYLDRPGRDPHAGSDPVACT